MAALDPERFVEFSVPFLLDSTIRIQTPRFVPGASGE
jgi:hypothetical protein